jgi:hypothetical protein
MVAYNFKAMFVDPILVGRKNHTIRGDRKRHARPGELIQLQHGSRFKPIRFGVSRCEFVCRIGLQFEPRSITIVGEDSTNRTSALIFGEFDDFAQADGFADWEALERFWWDTHKAKSFRGVIIGWTPLPKVGGAV